MILHEPHTAPINGILAKAAIQCICPETGIEGSFFYTGKSHRIPGTRVSPVHSCLSTLYPESKKIGWVETGKDRLYEFKGTPQNHG